MRAIVVVLLASACVDTTTTTCPGTTDLVCPRGTVCLALAPTDVLCVRPDQFPPCDGVDDMTECDGDGDEILDGTCYGHACLPAACGNLRIDARETCDDGGNIPGDGCSADCRSNERCGNGIVDPVTLDLTNTLVANEECDDGDLGSRDGCSSNCVRETLRWSQILDDEPSARGATVMTTDTARKRIVMFGGGDNEDDGSRTRLGDSWRWQQAWTRLPIEISPRERYGPGLAYDAKRGQVVMFGGQGSSLLRDTWILEGDRWTQRSPAVSPPARKRPGMAFHPDAGVVLFGGTAVTANANDVPLDDTWIWDGETWTQLALAIRPSARFDVSMVFDPARNVLVMFGGAAFETWEFDGMRWTHPPGVGPPVSDPTLGYDPVIRQVVMFGGVDSGGQDTQLTYRWTGQAWTLVATTGDVPPLRFNAAMANDPDTGDLIMFGGTNSPAFTGDVFHDLGDTWRFTGASWEELRVVRPPEVGGHVAALDTRRARVVRFGGVDSTGTVQRTWELDGTRWIDRGNGPSGRVGAAMAYDAARGQMVMFGGGGGSPQSETWVYDGASWTAKTPAHVPPGRAGHSMAYDLARDRIVMFGGDGQQRETWEWDGADWTSFAPTGAWPDARVAAAMAYDPIRQRVVLFGGEGSGLLLGDTWTWTGTAWAQMTPTEPPSPRRSAAMAWDGARERLVLFGGGAPAGDETWEWDGTEWSFLQTALRPPARTSHVLVSSPSGAGVIVLGGSLAETGNTRLDDAWLLTREAAVAYQTCGTLLDDDGDGLAGCDDEDCWVACSPLCPPQTSCLATAPVCGNGTCDPGESCRLCPGDCTCTPRCGDWFCDPGETLCPGDC